MAHVYFVVGSKSASETKLGAFDVDFAYVQLRGCVELYAYSTTATDMTRDNETRLGVASSKILSEAWKQLDSY